VKTKSPSSTAGRGAVLGVLGEREGSEEDSGELEGSEEDSGEQEGEGEDSREREGSEDSGEGERERV